jgi:hypothetical protein
LTVGAQPITLRGADAKSYGGLALRYGPRKKTTIVTTPGGRTEDLVVTRLPWADLSGDLGEKADSLSGIAILVHPKHPDHPPEWMARHYGMLAVGWPGVKERTLAPNESVTLRYRLWIHRAVREAADVQKAHDAYVAEATR